MTIRMPAEHGAWGILLVPLISSALVAGGNWVTLLLVTVCALGLFILRGSYEQSQCTRDLLSLDHALLALVTLLAGSGLVFAYHRTQLVLLGGLGAILYGIHAWLVARHEQNGVEKRSLTAELAGALLLTFSAPAAWIAQRATLDAEGGKIWLLNFLFFAGGVLYVKYRVRGLLAHRAFRNLRERAAFAWPVLVYHLLLALFLMVLIVSDSISALALAAFAPGILRASSLLFQLGAKFPIKRLGWSEVGHAVLFAALLFMAFR